MNGRTIICFRDNYNLRMDYVINLLNLDPGMCFLMERDHDPVRKGNYIVLRKLRVESPQFLFPQTKQGTPCLYYLLNRFSD